MTRTVPVVAYVTVDDNASQEDAEAIVAAALESDDRIYLAEASRKVELVSA